MIWFLFQKNKWTISLGILSLIILFIYIIFAPNINSAEVTSLDFDRNTIGLLGINMQFTDNVRGIVLWVGVLLSILVSTYIFSFEKSDGIGFIFLTNKSRNGIFSEFSLFFLLYLSIIIFLSNFVYYFSFNLRYHYLNENMSFFFTSILLCLVFGYSSAIISIHTNKIFSLFICMTLSSIVVIPNYAFHHSSNFTIALPINQELKLTTANNAKSDGLFRIINSGRDDSLCPRGDELSRCFYRDFFNNLSEEKLSHYIPKNEFEYIYIDLNSKNRKSIDRDYLIDLAISVNKNIKLSQNDIKLIGGIKSILQLGGCTIVSKTDKCIRENEYNINFFAGLTERYNLALNFVESVKNMQNYSLDDFLNTFKNTFEVRGPRFNFGDYLESCYSEFVREYQKEIIKSHQEEVGLLMSKAKFDTSSSYESQILFKEMMILLLILLVILSYISFNRKTI